MSAAKLLVRSAGGVVERDDGRVLVVHMRKRDGAASWGLPKGRIEPGEATEAAALREVLEEAGCACEVVGPLVTARYVNRRGAPREVHLFRMRPIEQRPFAPSAEIDEVRWARPRDAAELVEHAHERDVLLALENER